MSRLDSFDPTRPARIWRGQNAPKRARSTGVDVTDGVTEVDDAQQIIFHGATVLELEDAVADVFIGGGTGDGDDDDEPGDGTDPGNSSATAIRMLNNSGQDLMAGAVVVVDDTADRAVTVTDVAGSILIAGVVQEPITAGAIGPVLFNGYASVVRSVHPVERGQYAQTSTTEGEAQATDEREAGSFGVYVSAPYFPALVEAVAVTEKPTAGTSMTITMPAGLVGGRALFLALWLESGASSPVLTGWTRIGSTAGFYYYTKESVGGDTASATWTGSSIAAAAVAMLAEQVALFDPVEDFDYDATTSAAEVTGLSAAPRIALAAVQAGAATPAGWESVAGVVVESESGGGAEDLNLTEGTVTRDTVRHTGSGTWQNFTNTNDGSDTTFGYVASGLSAYVDYIMSDLGAAFEVTAFNLYGSVASIDQITGFEYSTNGTSWTALTGVETGNRSTNPTGATFTFTAPITARYWAIKAEAGGYHPTFKLFRWEILGAVDAVVAGTLVGKVIGDDATATSPFTGAAAQNDGVFALNLADYVMPSAILYGPDLAEEAGGVAPSDANYLVGTAQAGLSGEIVVGATPGGELGGTWGSPTVDATHSGSAHLALGTSSSTAAAGDHTHASSGGTPMLADDASSPFVFDDMLQNDLGTAWLFPDA